MCWRVFPKCLQCSLVPALDQFIKQISEPPTKVAAIGAGCSLATEPTAQISHYWQIPQVFIHSRNLKMYIYGQMTCTLQRNAQILQGVNYVHSHFLVIVGVFCSTALMYLIITKFGKQGAFQETLWGKVNFQALNQTLIIQFMYLPQLIQSEESLAYGYYGIIRNFKWRRVTIFLLDVDLFEVVYYTRIMGLKL